MAKQIILRIVPPSAGAADTLAQALVEAVAGLGEGGKSAMAGMGRTKKQVSGRDALLILTAGPGVTDDQVGAVADVARTFSGMFRVEAEVLEDGKPVAAPRAAAPAPAPAPAPEPEPEPEAEPEDDGGDDDGDGDDEEVPPYSEWSNADLAAECEARGLAKSGNKSDLVARLEANDAEDE